MGSVYKRGNIWWVKFYVNGEARYESSESGVKQVAIDILKKKLNTPGPRASGRLLVGELLDDLLTYYRTHNPKSYASFAVPVVANLRKYWGGWKAAKVSTGAVNHYKQERADQEASNGSINRELALLRRAYKLAFEATPQKVGMIPRFELLPEAKPRQGFLEPEQYRALLEALPAELQPVLVVGYHTGARKSEVLEIRKDQVDLSEGYINLRTGETKNGEGRALPIYGDMEAWIKPLLETPGLRLFTRGGFPIVSLRPAWENACKAAGVPGLLFHDLRRSAIRNMIRAGNIQETAMKVSGHKTAATFRRYNIVDKQDVENLKTKMNAFMKPGVAGKSTNGDNLGDSKQDVGVRKAVSD